MKNEILANKSVEPTEDMIFSIIGEKKLVWKQTMSYLYDNNNDITEVWKYYNDGKSWLFRTLKKKKTIFWINILDDTFRIAFYFADRLEPIILNSELSESLKTEYKGAKIFNKSRCIYIDIQSTGDFQEIKKLIDLKLENL